MDYRKIDLKCDVLKVYTDAYSLTKDLPDVMPKKTMRYTYKTLLKNYKKDFKQANKQYFKEKYGSIKGWLFGKKSKVDVLDEKIEFLITHLLQKDDDEVKADEKDIVKTVAE